MAKYADLLNQTKEQRSAAEVAVSVAQAESAIVVDIAKTNARKVALEAAYNRELGNPNFDLSKIKALKAEIISTAQDLSNLAALQTELF